MLAQPQPQPPASNLTAQVNRKVSDAVIASASAVSVLLCLFGLGLLISGEPWLSFVAIALYGAGNGILTIARGTLPLALFGARGYGSRMGLLARPVLVAQACGPILAARVLDTFGPVVLLGMLCCLLLV